MNNKALYNLSYGIFVLAAKAGDKVNACVTNTCIQVANNPTRVVVAVLNQNYTCDLLKQGDVFTVTMLDQSCSMETIAHFGYQSGRNVDKLEDIPLPVDANGVPYLTWHSCAWLSCKVISSQDLGSHTLFIAEVLDADVLSDKEPLTYAYYQNVLKPKPAEKKPEKKIVGWRCKICKFVYEGAELPADYTCPLCGHPAEDFEPIYES